MHRFIEKKDKLHVRIVKKANRLVLNLITLTTFLGILPVVLYMYYNLYNFSAIKVLTGCCLVLTIIKVNKSTLG